MLIYFGAIIQRHNSVLTSESITVHLMSSLLITLLVTILAGRLPLVILARNFDYYINILDSWALKPISLL